MVVDNTLRLLSLLTDVVLMIETNWMRRLNTGSFDIILSGRSSAYRTRFIIKKSLFCQLSNMLGGHYCWFHLRSELSAIGTTRRNCGCLHSCLEQDNEFYLSCNPTYTWEYYFQQSCSEREVNGCSSMLAFKHFYRIELSIIADKFQLGSRCIVMQ